MFKGILATIRGLLTRDRAHRELDEELRFHIDMETQANIAAGMSPAEAHRVALVHLGGFDHTKDAVRDVRVLLIESTWQDIRFALRRLRRERAFAVTAIVTIGLTVGLATTIFSVTHAVLFRELPYADPDALVLVGWSHHDDLPQENPYPLPENEYRYWAERNRVFQSIGGGHVWNVDLLTDSLPEPLRGQKITASLLPMLGLRTILGRPFLPEDELPGHARVVLLSEGLWRRAFGADPDVVGRRIRLQERGVGEVYEVVGVTPASFRFEYATEATSANARVSRGIDILAPATKNAIAADTTASFTTLARLKRGATLEQARRETRVLKANYARDFSRPGAAALLTKVVPLHEATFGRARPALFMLMASVGLVLLIGCANVASLLLARGEGQQQEMAVRAALGAGRRRLFQQLLTENLVLAMAGGSVGIVLSFWGTRVLTSVIPADLPRGGEVATDTSVLGFSVVVSLLSGMLFGLGPAARASRPDVLGTLRGRAITRGDRRWFRHRLVAAEVALMVVLVSATGLMLKSVWRMTRADLGFDPRNVLALQLHYGRRFDFDGEKRATFEQNLLGQVRTMRGVERAGLTSDLPFASGGVMAFELAGDHRLHWAEVFVVDPEYLAVLRLPLVRGRALSPGDTRRSPRVAVVNQALAERIFAAGNPLGQRIILKDPYEVVGVVASHNEMFRRPDDWRAGIRSMLRTDDDVQLIRALSPPAVYVPSAQVDWAGWLQYLVVRTDAHPGALVTSLRRAVASLDPTVSVKEVATFDEWMGLTAEAPRFYAVVLTAFSLAAIVLGAVGIYGVLAHSVGQRVHEIGVRIALGAEPAAVRRQVVAQVMPALAVGLSLGLVVAQAAVRMMRRFLFDVPPTDPWTFVSVVLLFLLVALAASYLPARRASIVDPMIALRCD